MLCYRVRERERERERRLIEKWIDSKTKAERTVKILK